MSGIELADLRPGDLMFGPIGGFVPGVLPVGLGQLLLAPRREQLTWRRWWHVRHVAVVVEAGAAPRIVQAMPDGAEEIELRQEKHWTARHVYVRPDYAEPEVGNHPDFGYAVAHAARKYVGTPYGFATYAYLAVAWALPPVGHSDWIERWLSKRIETRREMICSQLADQALTDAGFHVFDDGRLPQDVVPAELFRQLISMPGTTYCVPGMAAWAEGGQWARYRNGGK